MVRRIMFPIGFVCAMFTVYSRGLWECRLLPSFWAILLRMVVVTDPNDTGGHSLLQLEKVLLVVEPPIWKICSSNWIISPRIGVKIKNMFLTTTQKTSNNYVQGHILDTPQAGCCGFSSCGFQTVAFKMWLISSWWSLASWGDDWVPGSLISWWLVITCCTPLDVKYIN